MNKIAGDPTFRRRLLAAMPKPVADSFTDLQLTMVENAVNGMRWGEHPVDIRLSLPFWRRRFYLVFIAGPERRSAGRRAHERRKHPLVKTANFLIFGLFVLLLIPATVGVAVLLSMN